MGNWALQRPHRGKDKTQTVASLSTRRPTGAGVCVPGRGSSARTRRWWPPPAPRQLWSGRSPGRPPPPRGGAPGVPRAGVLHGDGGRGLVAAVRGHEVAGQLLLVVRVVAVLLAALPGLVLGAEAGVGGQGLVRVQVVGVLSRGGPQPRLQAVGVQGAV